jgi:hypothetical protein
MADMGRKPLLTLALRVKIIEEVENGNYIETAAGAAGIDESTIYNWLKRGRDVAERVAEFRDENPESEATIEEIGGLIGARDGRGFSQYDLDCVEFLDELMTARKRAEAKAVKNIRRHASKDWRAEAWYLARCYPERYSERRQVEVSGPEQGPIRVEGDSPKERLEAILARAGMEPASDD